MAVKVNYTPAPDDLSRLNPIQRYMQKGSLDFQDYLRLGAVVLLYWFLRPHIQRIVKRWSSESAEGEQEQEAYKQRRAQAAVSDNIRSGKKTADAEGKTLGELLDNGVTSTGTSAKTATSAAEEHDGEAKNRKAKRKGVSFAAEKSDIDRTLDWEDDSEFDPRRPPVVSEGGAAQSGDIKAWMEKWTA